MKIIRAESRRMGLLKETASKFFECKSYSASQLPLAKTEVRMPEETVI